MGILLLEPAIQFCKWNQDAIDRATILLGNPLYRAEVIQRTVHNHTTRQADTGCLLEQVKPNTIQSNGILLVCD